MCASFVENGSTHHRIDTFNISYPMCHGVEPENENKLDTNIEIEEM